jgi:hypothetical protein
MSAGGSNDPRDWVGVVDREREDKREAIKICEDLKAKSGRISCDDIDDIIRRLRP